MCSGRTTLPVRGHSAFHDEAAVLASKFGLDKDVGRKAILSET